MAGATAVVLGFATWQPWIARLFQMEPPSTTAILLAVGCGGGAGALAALGGRLIAPRPRPSQTRA
jgi:hypothetical protein